MNEFSDQLSRACPVFAEQQAGTAVRCAYCQFAAAARAFFRIFKCAAAREVFRKLWDDLIGFVNHYPVADSQTETVKDIKIMQIRAIDLRSVDKSILEDSGQAYHPGTGGRQLQTKESRLIQLVFPFKRKQAVLMVPGRAEGLPVGEIIVFDYQTGAPPDRCTSFKVRDDMINFNKGAEKRWGDKITQ